jgi:hypothetical protein
MNKVLIVFGVTILAGALAVSVIAGPRWQGGWGGGHMMGYGRGHMMGGYGGGHMMGYGGAREYGWNLPQARQWGQDQFQNRELRQAPPEFQGQNGPSFGPQHMGSGWGMNMVNPYGGGFPWGN